MAATDPLGFSAALVREVFPFHVAFDRNLRLTGLGRAMARLAGADALGAEFGRLFRIATPALACEFEAMRAQSFTVFFVDMPATGMTLKGQMLFPPDQPDAALFLCSPAVRDLAELTRLGLTLQDFAVHDCANDFLILLQTKNKTLDELRDMARRLRHEVAERRAAQEQLQRANAELEAHVAARTEALSQALHQLRTANAALVRRGAQMTLLNRLGAHLQSCRTLQETGLVVADAMEQIFPGGAGALLVVDESGSLNTRQTWGALPAGAGVAADCAALRTGRAVEAPCASSGACALAGVAGSPTCLPLHAEGATTGVLVVRDACAVAGACGADEADARRQLLHLAAEQIGLASANVMLRERLRQQAIRDPLTGAYNRRHMEESLRREAARARRTGKTIGMIMADIDHFKLINDRHGHQAGDLVLRAVGAFLDRHVRAEDIACRYGGEEFLLILPGVTRAAIRRRAEELRADVARNLRVEHQGRHVGPVTLSLGAGAFPIDAAHTVEQALRATDAALYRAKQAGRNRVALAAPAARGTTLHTMAG